MKCHNIGISEELKKTNFTNKKDIKRIIAFLLLGVLLLSVVLSATGCGVPQYSTDVGSADDWKETEVDTKGSGGLYYWIGTFLGWISKIMPGNSYILALLIFAIIWEALMLPFGIKQQRNSIKQARLRPKEMAIKKKYAGREDQATKQKMQREIQEMYQNENFNQFAGCLGTLIQLPAVIIIYNVVVDPLRHVIGFSNDMIRVISSYMQANGVTFNSRNGSVELISKIKENWQANPAFFDGLKDYCKNGSEVLEKLGEKINSFPNFSIGKMNFGITPKFFNEFGNIPLVEKLLIIVPILTFVVYFLSMKLNRKLMYQPATADDRATGCSNNMMDIVMPAFSVWISFSVPAAIGVYWIFRSAVGTLKSFLLKLAMPYPQFTEEDYKAAERELAGKMPKKDRQQREYDPNRPPVRSLHHIDDEDYDEKGNYIGSDTIYVSADDEDDENEGSEKKIEIPEKTSEKGISHAPLKDESEKPVKGKKNDKNDNKDTDKE